MTGCRVVPGEQSFSSVQEGDVNLCHKCSYKMGWPMFTTGWKNTGVAVMEGSMQDSYVKENWF